MDSRLTTDAARGPAREGGDPDEVDRPEIDGSGETSSPERPARPPAAGTWRRRRLLILKDFQLTFMLYQGLAILLCLVGIAAAVFAPLISGMETTDELKRNEYASQLLALHDTFWPAAILGFCFLLIFSVHLSHRIAGPLYRLRSAMSDVGRGRLGGPVRLRKNDFLMEDADVFNAMVESLRGRLSRVRDKHDALSEAIVALSAPSHELDRAWRDRVEALRSRSRELEYALAGLQETDSAAVPATGDAREE